MLHSMLLDGFRSFEGNVAVSFAPLTILAGANNVGKSSVIQALLAFVQSEQAQSSGTLLLNGMWSDLGAFEQVISAGRASDSRSFSIGLAGEERPGVEIDALWRFGPPDESVQSGASIAEVQYQIRKGSRDVAGRVHSASSDKFQWEEEVVDTEKEFQAQRVGEAFFDNPSVIRVSAANPLALGSPSEPRYNGHWVLGVAPLRLARTWHVGPFRAPPQPLYAHRSSPLGPQLGRHGEHTAELLFRNRAQRTDVLLSGDEHPLLSAVNTWWSYVFDGGLALQIDAPARLGYTLAVDTPSAERLGLGQVGFGLSQTLPIIAAGLISTPGDLLLLETPEAHLNPGAQHRLTSLFVELARRGRQVVVETHSEHLLHAAYLAVKAGSLSPDDIAISFFEQQDGRTSVRRIGVDPQGRALQAPKGFFDQAAIDLAELLR